MAKKKKKKWTQAARDAFARKMKKARAQKSGTKTKRRKKSMKKTTFAKEFPKVRKRSKRKGVPAMARKKHSRKSGGSSKKSYRRTRKVGGVGKGAVMDMVKDAAIAIGGGIAAGALANKLPIQQPLIKALSPAIAGILLMFTIGKKNPLVRQLATGMVVMGGVAGVRAQFPNVPLLAGEEEVSISPDLLGVDDLDQLPNYSGMGVEDLGQDVLDEEYETAADV